MERAPFPRDASPPTAYAAARLDLQAFLGTINQSRAEDAPVTAHLLMPNGSYVEVRVRTSSAMAPEISTVFPELQNYTFESVDGKMRGRLGVGPGGLYVYGQGPERLMRVEPLQTAVGVFYVSFFDCDRTDTVAVAALPRF